MGGMGGTFAPPPPRGGGVRHLQTVKLCGPGVIQQFALPLAPIEGRVSSTWVFPTTLGTSGLGS